MIDHAEAFRGFVRHAFTFGGGFLVASGDLTLADLETLTGAVTSLAGLIWSVIAKRRQSDA